MDPVTDAIEQAARGGVELTLAQIDYLRQLQLERGPGVRFVIHTEPMLAISVLDPDHEEFVARREREHANLPDWARQLRQEAVAVAFPEWTWQDGDDADLETFTEYDSSGAFKGFGFFVSVERPGTDMRLHTSVRGEQAAELIHAVIMAGTSEDPES